MKKFNQIVPILGIVIMLPLFVIFLHQQTQIKQHAATPTSPSGATMPVGDIAGWHQIFTDDFTTNVPLGSFPNAVSDKWNAYPDEWKDTSKNGTYYPSKVISIQNGVMNLYLHTENGIHMVSAPEPKLPGGIGKEGGLLYGRYVIRFKSDPIPGYKTAWLLWPDSETWPRDGEIDFPEGDLNNTINGFMHRQNGTSGGDQDAFSTNTTYTSWHTAIIEWSPNKLNFILDGQIIGTSTNRVPNTPMHWVIQTETALNGTAPSNTASGNVQIDWVAVYTPASTNTTGQTNTPTPIQTQTITPTKKQIKTMVSLAVCPHGLGNCGDSMQPDTGGNKNVVHPQRTVTVSAYDANNTLVTKQQGTVIYNNSAGNFTGTIDMGNFVSGNYLVRIHMDGFLDTLLPGIQKITVGQVNNLPDVSLIAGDVNNDNQRDIQDYNILFSCFDSKFNTAACPTKESDLNDDGQVDGIDYNLFMRELSVQQGQ